LLSPVELLSLVELLLAFKFKLGPEFEFRLILLTL